MATIKVKFRPSTVSGKAGSVYYQICRNGTTTRIPAGITLLPEHWDRNRLCIIRAPHDEAVGRVRRRIESDISHLRRIIDNADTDQPLSDIVAQFRRADRGVTLLAYIERQIEQLKSVGKLGTTRNYRRTAASFAKFLDGGDMPLRDFGRATVANYSKWLLDRDIARNSSSFYMRVLRSVYNKAVKERIVCQSFPFRGVYTGVDRTRKRAVDESAVIRLYRMDLGTRSRLAMIRDLFIFSYCTRGMAFIDMAFLRKRDIAHGNISYCRHKTGQRLIIRMEPCIARIVERYAPLAAATPYVFPLISAEEPEAAFRQYNTALGYYNRKLKELARIAGIDSPLSSYMARHTWATTARNHAVPLAVISAAMGHTSERTTQIYLASLENSVIDRANHHILTPLNGSAAAKGTSLAAPAPTL